MPEPRRDQLWAARGEDLEDLSRLAEAQAWEHEGLATSRAGLELLLQAAQRRLRAKKLDEAQTAALAELQAGELLDDRGELTEQGFRFTEVMRRADRHIRVEASASLAPLTLDAYWYGSIAVLILTDPPSWWAGQKRSGAEIAEMAQRVWLQEVPTSYLPVAIAAWLEVGPAGAMATGPALLPMATLTARADDPDTPVPDGADDLLREVWRQPWFLWTLQTSADQGLVGVRAGQRGHFSLSRSSEDEEVVRFQTWPAEPLWASIVSVTLN